MKELLIMAKSLGGGGSEVALIELINALPEELYNIRLNQLSRTKEAYGRYRNVFLEDYSELEMRPAFCTTWMAIIQACECCWAT